MKKNYTFAISIMLSYNGCFFFMEHIVKKLLLIIGMGFLVFSCSNAQEKKEKSVKEYNAKEIIKLLNKGKEVVISNAIIKDDLIFSDVEDTDFTFPTGFTANVTVSIYFQSCVFMGDVKSVGKKKVGERNVDVKTHFRKDVTFMDCDFRKEVDFNESQFDRTINFSKTVFRGYTQFNDIYCLGKKNQWWELEADSSFMMCGASFLGDVNMMDAKFKKDASLQGFSVNNLQISNIEVEEAFDLSKADIKGYLICNYGQFNGDANLSFGRFLGRTDITNSTFKKGFEIEKSLFYGQVKLNKSVFSQKIATEQSHFMLLPETEETQYPQDSTASFNGFK